MNERAFRVAAEEGPRGTLWVPVPFDPDEAWGRKPEHRIHGSINGVGIRASVESAPDGALGFRLGPAWRRDCGVNAGVPVDVVVRPEGPQRDDLAQDIADVFEANQDAGAFFDGLAQFYRRAYLRWIDATKRSPEKRAERIAEVVALLEQGIKQRPGT